MNKVILIGNVGQDIEVKGDEKKYCRFSLATTNYKGETDWHNCTAFSKTAELMGNHVSKGQKIAVEGAIGYSDYEKDGVKMKSTSIAINHMEFVTPKKKATEEAQTEIPF